MSRPFAPTLLFAVALGLLGVVAVTVFHPLDPETPSLFAGSAFVLLLVAGYLFVRDRGAADAGDLTARVIPDSSVPAAWAAISLAAMALGAELGFWLVLIGAGMLAAGIGGLLRESRAARQTADRVLGGPGRAGKPTVGGEDRGPRTGQLPGED